MDREEIVQYLHSDARKLVSEKLTLHIDVEEARKCVHLQRWLEQKFALDTEPCSFKLLIKCREEYSAERTIHNIKTNEFLKIKHTGTYFVATREKLV
uniref:Uncharacterized protein n=1 Tax=Ditylenchus dipsaci TaxID=166011 RepID=A0A915D7P3_9BILA